MLHNDVKGFVAMRKAPDATYALLGRALEEVGADEDVAAAGRDYKEMVDLHNVVSQHVAAFGHPDEGNPEGRRVLQKFKLGTDDPMTTRPRGVDTGLRTLPWALANKFQELLNKYCTPNSVSPGEKSMPSIQGPVITMEVNFGGCVLEKAEGSALPTALRCDKGFIGYAKTPGSISGPAKGGTSYEGSFCPPITTTIPKKKEPIVKSFGGEAKAVWKSKKLK